jgi:hypothetical protein
MRTVLAAAAAILIASSASAVVPMNTLSQSFAASSTFYDRLSGFEAGRQYQATFTALGSPRLIVSATGGVAQLFDLGNSVGSTPVAYNFFASGPIQAFAIKDLEGGDLIIDDFQVSLVPEPAVWGLMIAGFAVIGGLARRRRTRAPYTAA